MTHPVSTEHPIQFPVKEAWRNNPRLSTGQSIASLLQRAGYNVQKS